VNSVPSSSHVRPPRPTDVLDWIGGQPYLNSDVEPDEVRDALMAADRTGATSAVAFVREPWGERDHPWITALGDPAALPELVPALLEENGAAIHGGLIGGLTAPAELRSILSQRLAAMAEPVGWAAQNQGAPWDWWWTSSVVVPDSPFVVEWLAADDPDVAARIRDLLAVASPTHWAPPEHPAVRRWAGITSSDGMVLACAAETVRITGRPHLASVATHPDERGRGMAAAVVGWITNALLQEGAPLVSLGMYAHNDVARRVYTRLGYSCAYSWFSSGFASIPASDLC
jgi:GNAT superfamily N-acetyltransferase